VSTAAQLAATRLFEIRPLPLRLGMPFYCTRRADRAGYAAAADVTTLDTVELVAAAGYHTFLRTPGRSSAGP
jgi:hypothetical protein